MTTPKHAGLQAFLESDIQFQTFLAKLFGRAVAGRDGDNVATGYIWRGRIYLTDFTLNDRGG